MRSINLGRWSRRVERYFNMKGGGGLVDVEQSLRMVLPFASGVEERYLESWSRFAVVNNVAPVAAQNSRARIRNPGASNVVIVLEQLAVYVGTADSVMVTWGAATGDLANLISLAFTRMDPRGQPQPVAVVSNVAGAVSGQQFLQRVIASNTTADYITSHDQQIPILPGQVVDLNCTSVNNNMVVTYMWRERAMEASELT